MNPITPPPKGFVRYLPIILDDDIQIWQAAKSVGAKSIAPKKHLLPIRGK